MPKIQPSPTAPLSDAKEAGKREKVTRLMRDLATRPPAKDVANLRAASEVYEANAEPEADGGKTRSGDPVPREPVDGQGGQGQP